MIPAAGPNGLMPVTVQWFADRAPHAARLEGRLVRDGWLDAAEDVIHDARQRGSGVDRDAAGRNLLPCSVQVLNQLPFCLASSPFVLWALIQPLLLGFQVHLKNEDTIEEIDELGEVPRPAAEKGHRFPRVRGQRPDLVHPPEVVPVYGDSGDAAYRFSGFRITLIGEFIADCRLAGARAAFDEVVLPAHP